MSKPTLPNVLAQRYASTTMVEIHSPRAKIIAERKLWIAALNAMWALNRPVALNAIMAYEAVVEQVDFDSIATRERRTRHDVLARIEEFNALAGYDLVHQGFTSRDLTENVEQSIIVQSLSLVRDRAVSVLASMRKRALEFQFLAMCGRSHLVPGQAVTLGKRFANWMDELLITLRELESFIDSYPLRGIKGPMGTQQDMIDLLGSAEAAGQFEQLLCKHLGMTTVLTSTGQVYPRVLDHMAIERLVALASAPANMALAIRLFSGLGLGHEGFGKEQKGSSGMPHKVNCRTSERIHALFAVLNGYAAMTKALVGNQWLEGDVSCSVVRRVAMTDAFLAVDGIFESALTILEELQIFPEMVRSEVQMYLPFLSSSRLLTAVIKAGSGRQEMHAVIKEHAVAVIDEWRNGLVVSPGQELVTRLAQDSRYPLGGDEISALVAEVEYGRSASQVDEVAALAQAVIDRYPEAARYTPEPLL